MIAAAADELGESGDVAWRSKHGHLYGLSGGGFRPEVGFSAGWQWVQPQQAVAAPRGLSARATRQHQPGGSTRARLLYRTRDRTRTECIMSDHSRLRNRRDLTIPSDRVYATREGAGGL